METKNLDFLKGIGSGVFIFLSISINTLFAQNIDELIPYRKGDKWGYVDQDKNIVVPINYDYAERFIGDRGRVWIGYKFGFIDLSGKEVMPLKFELPKEYFNRNNSGFQEGLIAVSIDGKTGFIDKWGNMIIEPKFEYAVAFSEGRSAFYLDYKWGYIDKEGSVIVEPIYEMALPFINGIAQVELRAKNNRKRYSVFIDTMGNKIFPVKYKVAERVNPHLVMLGSEDSTGLFTNRGKEIVPMMQGQTFGKFSDGLARFKRADEFWGYIDTTGNVIISPNYMMGTLFKEGLAVVIDTSGKTSIIDKKGEKVMSFEGEVWPYDMGFEKTKFSNGIIQLMAVNSDNSMEDIKIIYVNRTGDIVDFGDSVYVGEFHEGLALTLTKYDMFGFVDNKANLVIPLKYFIRNEHHHEFYDDLNFTNGLAKVYSNGKQGFIDKNGTEYFEDQHYFQFSGDPWTLSFDIDVNSLMSVDSIDFGIVGQEDISFPSRSLFIETKQLLSQQKFKKLKLKEKEKKEFVNSIDSYLEELDSDTSYSGYLSYPNFMFFIDSELSIYTDTSNNIVTLIIRSRSNYGENMTEYFYFRNGELIKAARHSAVSARTGWDYISYIWYSIEYYFKDNTLFYVYERIDDEITYETELVENVWTVDLKEDSNKFNLIAGFYYKVAQYLLEELD
ncbi:MAG: WG repeat-containing protein [Bacteroidetes bacterium]|nr:WG repeat-containing protein [Bacteroidota bacterium]